MQKLLKFLFLLNISLLNSYAASLELTETSDPVIKLMSDSTTEINNLFVTSSGDARTLDAAPKIYAPIGLSSGTPSSNYFISGVTLPKATGTSGGIQLTDVSVTGVGSTEKIYTAILNNDDSTPTYRIIGEVTNQINPFVPYTALCLTDSVVCEGFSDSTASIKPNLELVIFVASSDADYSNNDDVNVDDIPDAVGQALFFKLIMSSSTIISSQTPLITADYDGDSMGVIEYTGDFGSNSKYISRIVSYTDTSSGTLKGASLREVNEGVGEEGSITVRNLANNQTYFSSIAYVDHFGFTSQLSSEVTLTPRPIEALLAANQCYFVTAGFQRNHYVLNYFRYIRDEFLLKSTVGKAFVDFYYSSAPQYVGYILNNKSIAHRVKSYSFSTYFVLQNMASIIGCMLLLAVFNYFRRQRREQFYALQSSNC